MCTAPSTSTSAKLELVPQLLASVKVETSSRLHQESGSAFLLEVVQ